ncbi:MAG: hypothetical protein ACXAEU_15355 [Candidatus Hodarchaeales archaeon]
MLSREDLLDIFDSIQFPRFTEKQNMFVVPKDQWNDFIRKAPKKVAKMGIWELHRIFLRLEGIFFQEFNFIKVIATSRPLINSMLIDSFKLRSTAKKIKEIDFPTGSSSC